MARILILGTGPLLEDGARVMSGQCLRTWHFTAPLLAAGHRVRLMTVPIPGATREEAERPWEHAHYRGHRYVKLLSNAEHRILKTIRRAMDGVDAVVGINAWPAYLIARALEGRRIPFWADLNGWTMAEGQIRGAALGHDRDYAHFWRLEAATLLAADFFSTVSHRQADALVGELAMLGLLTHERFSERVAVSVPNAVYPDYAELERTPGIPDNIRERLPADAAICLWSGGFNSWTDVDLLTAGLRLAMEREPRLHFVSTGGPVIGHDEETHRCFETLAGERLPAGRAIGLGWIDFEDVLKLHASATVGINIDGTNTETRFGARNRLTNMLGAGLPALTTRGTEIAEWIESHEAGGIMAANADDFAAHLVDAVRDASSWEQRAVHARALALEDFAPANTLSDFLEWAANPRLKSGTDAGDDPADTAFRLRRWIATKSNEALPFTERMASPAPTGLRAQGRRARNLIRRLRGRM